MPNRDAQILRAALIVLLALLSCHTWFGPDTWYHLAWGRLILQTGTTLPNPPVLMRGEFACNQYWLYQVWLELTYRAGGVRLVSACFVIIWIAIAAAWSAIARVSRSPAPGLIALFAFVACVQLRLEYRPETFSFLFFTAMLWLMTRPPRPWTTPALIAIEIAWANVHGYFPLGIALAVAAALARPARRAWVLALALTLAPLVNPGGWAIVRSLGTMIHILRDLGAELEELTPTTRYAWWYWPLPIFWAYYAATALLTARALFDRRTRFAGLVGLGALVLGVRTFRFVPLTMIMTAPLVATLRRPARVPAALTALGVGAAAAAAALVIGGGFHRWRDSGTTFGFGVETSEYPVRATRALRARGFAGRIFNEPTDGGYLEYELPAATIACDSSYNDAGVARAYFASVRDPAAFDDFDRGAHFDAALISVQNLALTRALLHRPGWTVAFADLTRVLFVRGEGGGPLRPDFDPAEDPRRYGYRESLAAWRVLAELEGDPGLAGRLGAEFTTP